MTAPAAIRWGGIGRLAFWAIAIAVIVVLAGRLSMREALADLLATMRDSGLQGVALYALVYVVACVLMVPGSSLTFAAGAAWGPWLGALVAVPASVLGATAAFLVARHVARPWVRRRLATRPVAAAVDRAVAERGALTVGLLRMAPVLPFNLLNYALGASSVRLRDYVLGTLVGMLPVTVMVAQAGAVAGSLAGVTPDPLPTGAARVLLIASFVTTAIMIVLVTRRARRVLADAMREKYRGLSPFSGANIAGVAKLTVRQRWMTTPLMGLLRRVGVPVISETERIALEAGTTWIDAEIFSGCPDWKRILAEPYPDLSAEERAFLDGPCRQACEMVDDWAVARAGDLTPDTWAFLKRERFFAMIIPKEHGGLAFSARAQAAVVTMLASRSIPLAVTVMVPNSLGPAELLVHYGTKEQQRRHLPRLARGEEIPCFALTEPEAGSDASSMRSEGVVERGPDGQPRLRLHWNKRYITLAPVATLLGVAFKLRDPDELLGKGKEPGITCALIPRDTPGVEAGRRHDPMGLAFLNGPTTGKDVVVPVDAIIGGRDGAGQGWRMLMECLAAGRAISLPSLSVGSSKVVARVAGAHAAVRRQFGIAIGRFEGIEEPLARIAGLTWLMEAAQVTTCGGLAHGGKPSVISAMAKLAQTELAREVVRDGMDVVAGNGIVRGPRNRLAAYWIGQPIGITVEGANILTRSLIVFGQGVIRCHPFAWAEADAIARGDVAALDAVIWRHGLHVARNAVLATLLAASRGWLAIGIPSGPSARWARKLSWASADLALMSEIALASLGGDLKRREKLAGRLADVAVGIYLGMAAVRRFEAEGRREEDLPFLEFACRTALARAFAGMEAAMLEFPVPALRWLFRPAAMVARISPYALPPGDEVGRRLARALQEPGPMRDRLVAGTHLSASEDDALARLENALALTARAQPVAEKIRTAMKSDRLPRTDVDAALDLAIERGVIQAADARLVRDAEAARRDAIQVDSF